MKRLRQILLIDDDPICSWLNKTLLEELQLAHQVDCLCDGTEALNFLEKISSRADEESKFPDLILLDLNMPGADGFEVLEKLQQNKSYSSAMSQARVIVLTTSMHQRDVEKAKTYNILGYLVKPLTEAKLKKALVNFYPVGANAGSNDASAIPENGATEPVNLEKPFSDSHAALEDTPLADPDNEAPQQASSRTGKLGTSDRPSETQNHHRPVPKAENQHEN